MIPDWLEALILGVVQGLTEFIPVSSSAHLVLVPYLGGFEERTLAFDVVLHIGTLAAVLLYFRAELLAMARGILGLDRTPPGRAYRRVGLLLVPASVPVAVVGLVFADAVEEAFEDPLTTSLLLLVTAAILIAIEQVRDRRVRRAAAAGLLPGGAAAAADQGGSVPVTGARAGAAADAPPGGPAWRGSWRAAEGGEQSPAAEAGTPLPLGTDLADPGGTDLSGITLGQAMAAGAMQCLAVLPGISRSGSTLAGGLFAGLTREAATRFSFLLAIPALVGATLLSIGDIARSDDGAGVLLIGALASFTSGYLAVSYLVRLVSRERLTGFAYYCLAASAVGLIGYAILGAPSAA